MNKREADARARHAAGRAKLRNWERINRKWRSSYEGSKRYAIMSAAHGNFGGGVGSRIEQKKSIINQYEKGVKMKNKNKKNQPQTVSDLYASPWLHVDDLNGRSVTLTIERVEFDEFPEKPNDFNGEKVIKAILDFGRSKKMILNKTQCLSVAQIADSEAFDQWSGVRITLSPAMAKNNKPTIAISAAPIVSNDDEEE